MNRPPTRDEVVRVMRLRFTELSIDCAMSESRERMRRLRTLCLSDSTWGDGGRLAVVTTRKRLAELEKRE